MQRLGGLLLVMAGVSLGAYTFLPPPSDGEQALREMTRISAAPDRAPAERSAWVEPPEAAPTAPGTGAPPASAAGTPTETAALAKPSATWSAIVTAEPAQQGRITSSKPGDDETRIQLTRDLQTELKRVGCYSGEVTGTWTPSSKRAMSTFMERVNASLPIDEPDYILLTLVQGHAAQACGAACPSGQSAAEDGRCMPQAVLAARAAKKTKQEARAEEPRRAAPAVVAVVPPAPKPAVRAEPAQKKVQAKVEIAPQPSRPAVQDKTQTVAAASNAREERLPWLEDDLSKPAPAPKVRRPDGMMAIGAPAPAVTIEPAPRAARVPVDTSEDDERRAKATPVLRQRPEVAARGLPGTKAGPAVTRTDRPLNKPQMAKAPKRKAAIARHAPQPPAYKPKPKFFYYASKPSRRGMPRPGSPAYNMLQAMGGIY